MISRVEIILSVVLYEKKTLFFMKKTPNLRKMILLIMFFVIEFFFTIASYQSFKNHSFFIIHGSFFREKYSLQL